MNSFLSVNLILSALDVIPLTYSNNSLRFFIITAINISLEFYLLSSFRILVRP